MLRLSDAGRHALCRRQFISTPWLGSLVLALATACGGSSDTGTTNPPPTGGGGFTLSASASTASLAQNASGAVTISVTRTGSFTGAVTFAASGLPSGVTATLNPTQVAAGQTSCTLTLSVTATAAVGTTTITIKGSATGLADQAVTVALTITPATQAGPFSLSLSATSYLALGPTFLPSSPVLTITRNAGFTGSVTFSVTGLPLGLLVAVTPTTVTGNSGSLLILNAAAPNGTYPVTIHGTGGGGEQTVTLQVVIAPPTTGSIHWQFCTGNVRSVQYFFALKDGNGAWTRIVPDTTATLGVNMFSFNITQPTASVALVTGDAGGFRTTIYQYTAQEMAAVAASECALYPGATTRNVNVSVAGLRQSEVSLLAVGGWVAISGNFSNLLPGPLDLVAVRDSITQLADIIPNRVIIRRGLNPASGSALPTADFAAAESFASTTSTWTFGNVGSDGFSVNQFFATAGGATGELKLAPGADNTATARAVYGIPLAQTITGDLQEVIATTTTLGTPVAAPNHAMRQIIAYARTLSDRSISFGPSLPAPTVTVVSGAPAGRLRAQGTLPTEYQAGVSFDVTQTTTARFATIHTTRGFLGGSSTYDVQIPDFSAAVGWDTNFALRTGSATNWWVSGGGPVLDFIDARYIFSSTKVRWTGATTGSTAPSDGSVYLMGRALGTTTP